MTTIQQETGLDNSTVLLPRDGERSDYNIINHRRWDRLRDVLPSLAFRKSFSTFVLANLEANNVGAMPILYRMARDGRPRYRGERNEPP